MVEKIERFGQEFQIVEVAERDSLRSTKIKQNSSGLVKGISL